MIALTVQGLFLICSGNARQKIQHYPTVANSLFKQTIRQGLDVPITYSLKGENCIQHKIVSLKQPNKACIVKYGKKKF